MKKIIILTITVFGLFYLSSCCLNPGTCPGGETIYYKTKSMTAYLSKSDNEVNCESSIGSKYFLHESDTVYYSNMHFYINFQTTWVEGDQNCAMDEEITDTIKTIIVTSNNDYNSDFSAGEPLNEIIKLKKIGYYSEAVSCTPLDEYLINNKECMWHMSLFFTTPPDTTRLHKFHLYYEETDGTVYEADFTPVYIKP